MGGDKQQFRGTDRFELLRKLGEGGMGVVFEAHDHERDMRVALKTVRGLDATRLYRFKREFRALADMSHPNIINLYELVSHKSHWFFTMEIVRAVDFITWVRPEGWREPRPAGGYVRVQARLLDSPIDATADTAMTTTPASDTQPEAHPEPSEQLPEVSTARCKFAEMVDEQRLRDGLGQLASALHAVHLAGLVHRDLKPSNVRVSAEGRVVLMDFGIVAEMADTGVEDRSTSGTPAFMAPEQVVGDKITPAADWYALGVVLFKALSGVYPFSGPGSTVLLAKQDLDAPPIDGLVSGVPEDLSALCDALLRRKAIDRPSSEHILGVLGVSVEAAVSSTDTPAGGAFVGRADELAVLHDALNQSRRPQLACALVVGRSGMGKSTLVRRFVHELDSDMGAQRALILRGRCYERETVPYKAFDAVMDNLARALLTLPEPRRRILLPKHFEHLLRLFPVLRRAARGRSSGPSDPTCSPEELRYRAFGALRELLGRMADAVPLVLYVDDLQWADRDSLDLLQSLAAPVGAPPMLFIGTVRAESLSGQTPLEELMAVIAKQHYLRRIEVGALGSEEQQRLVRTMLGPLAKSTLLEQSMWGEADGNPLLLGELVRHVQEHGGELPAVQGATLEGVLYRRMSHLPSPARALLQMVVVFGVHTPLWVLGDAAGLDSDERERALSVLRAASMVRLTRHGTEPWVTGYHDRVRETLVARMSPEQSREAHLRAAAVLERWEDAGADRLAQHWLAAGEPIEAFSYLVRAAEAAANKLAFDQAAEQYASALELHEVAAEQREALLPARADALAHAGRHFEAAEAYEQAAVPASGLLRFELSRRVAENLIKSGRIERGLDSLRRVLAEQGIDISPTRRRARWSLVAQRAKLMIRGMGFKPRAESEVAARDLARLDALHSVASTVAMIDHIRGGVLQTKHLLLALRLGEPRRIHRALAAEAIFASSAGMLKRAEKICRRIEAAQPGLADPYLKGSLWMAKGATAFWGSQFAEAAEAFSRAEQVAASDLVGAEWERITSRFFYCMARINMGSFADAADAVGRFVEDAERRQDAYALNLFKTQPMVYRLLRLDQDSEALSVLEGALAGWPDEPFMAHYFERIARVVVHLYRGDTDRAHQLLVQAAPMFRENMLGQVPLVMLEYHMYHGRAAVAEGARKPARAAMRFLRRYGNELGRALWAGLQATAASLEGASSDAVAALLEIVIESGEQAQTPHLVAAARYRLGQLRGGGEGDALCQQAIDWAKQEGFVAPERYLRSLLPGFCAPTDGVSSLPS